MLKKRNFSTNILLQMTGNGKLSTLLEVRRDAVKLQHGHELILERMDGQEAWLRFVTGNLGAEKGQTLEDMFAVALRYGLKTPDIAPEKIRLRQRLVDAEGEVFKLHQ